MFKGTSYFRMLVPAIAAALILFTNMTKAKTEELPDINIVLLADVKDHGENEHDYPLWQKKWAMLLGDKDINNGCQKKIVLGKDNIEDVKIDKSKVKLSTAWEWPSDEQFKSADVIVAYCYLHWNPQRIKQVEEYLTRGGGLVVLHPASWTEPQPLQEVANLIGISGFKHYRHDMIDLRIIEPNHPICKGLHERIFIRDESYWPPVLKTDIEVLATTEEREDSNAIKPQPMIWTHTFGKGRVFGCLLGHYTSQTFDNYAFMPLILRGIAWAGNRPANCFDRLVQQGATHIGSPMTIKE
jgi:type 1 glutamine amidotransferase